MTRFVCISDTHTLHSQMLHHLPDGDILIHAGDGLSQTGGMTDFNRWFRAIRNKFERMIYVPGNHCVAFARDRQLMIDRLREGVGNLDVLINTSVKIGKYNIHGVPQTPNISPGWAFTCDLPEKLWPYYNGIPDDTNVLVSHGPPANVGQLDVSHHPKSGSYHLGCSYLANRVAKIGPKLHVFGHIHSGYGQYTDGRTRYVNAAICNAAMKPVNKPIVVDLP